MNEQTKAAGRMPTNKLNIRQGKNYLLMIGIDKYNDAYIPKLRNAVKDIERLEEVLSTHYDFDVHKTLSNAYATRASIIEAVESLHDVLTASDNLIIFFSGHGYRKGSMGFIVPVDGDNDSTTNYINFGELNQRINELPMRHFLLILDCCYAGSALSRSFGEQYIFNKRSRRIIAASQEDEKAVDGFGSNSPFTVVLSDILENTDKETLPTKELFTELRRVMNSKGISQTPVEGEWQMVSNENGEFVFVKKQSENAAWKKALRENSVTAFESFKEKYPLSIYALDADKIICERQKEAAEAAHTVFWERIKEKDTADAYLAFWKNNPDSPYRNNAWELLREREDDELWEQTPKRPSGAVAYLDLFPNGRHKEGADAIIKLTVTEPSISIQNPHILSKTIEFFIRDCLHVIINYKNAIRYTLIVMLIILLVLIYFNHSNRTKMQVKTIEPSVIDLTEPNIPFSDPFEKDLVEVKGGIFNMGDVKGDNERSDEKSINSIVIADFYISQTEVTQEQWQDIMEINPSNFRGSDLPVENVSWNDIQEFFDKLNTKTGIDYRLPTEAEWEYAAREGGKNVRFGNGKNIADPDQINFNGRLENKKPYSLSGVNRKQTTPVGSFKPNSLGLYDMSGNVWEWCSDKAKIDTSKREQNLESILLDTESNHIIRGGSWHADALSCRVSNKNDLSANIRLHFIGFRIALSPNK